MDFWLTLERFALLNVVWAITIVVLEVPTGVLMVAEMALLCFAPRGNAQLLLVLFLVNRVLSGTAEAAASGADEALAYDALKAEGDINDWSEGQEKTSSILGQELENVIFIKSFGWFAWYFLS